MWSRAVVKKEQFCVVILKTPLLASYYTAVNFWFRAVFKMEQF